MPCQFANNARLIVGFLTGGRAGGLGVASGRKSELLNYGLPRQIAESYPWLPE